MVRREDKPAQSVQVQGVVLRARGSHEHDLEVRLVGRQFLRQIGLLLIITDPFFFLFF